MVYDSGNSALSGCDLYRMEYSSALLERLSKPGGGVTKFVTLIDFQI